MYQTLEKINKKIKLIMVHAAKDPNMQKKKSSVFPCIEKEETINPNTINSFY